MTELATVETRELSKLERQSALRRKLELVEDVLKTLPQIEIPLRHFFINGALAREMTMPKDGLWIGRTHKYDQINFLLKGDMSVLIDGVMTRVQAPYTYVAPSGTKRAGFAHEDSVWTCVVSTPGRLLSEDDRDEIDTFFVAATDAEYLEYIGQQALLEGEK